MICASNKISDSPSHPHSLIRIFAGHWPVLLGYLCVAKNPKALHANSNDQTAQTCRYIRVFAGFTYQFLGFDVSRPIIKVLTSCNITSDIDTQATACNAGMHFLQLFMPMDPQLMVHFHLTHTKMNF